MRARIKTMRPFLLAIAALASVLAIPVSAQDSALDKITAAKAEANTAENLIRTADETWCKKLDLTECRVRVHAAQLAMRRVHARLDEAAAAVRQRPATLLDDGKTVLVAEGDSITSPEAAGYHAWDFHLANPSIEFHNEAVGGSTLKTLLARRDATLALKPDVLTVFVGANDFDFNDPAGYAARVFAYAAPFRALGTKVYVATLTPTSESPARRNQARALYAAALDAAVDKQIDGVIDFGRDPVMGADNAWANKTLYSDGFHPTALGQQWLNVIYTATMAPVIGAPVPIPTLEQATVPAWGTGKIPGIYDKHEGAFRFTCGGDGPITRDDPVVYPGQPGRAHLHQGWGNMRFDANLTTERLLANPATNCNDTPFSANRSSYWSPLLIHDSGEGIRPDLVSVYYKRKTSASPYCTPGDPQFMGTCVELPAGIKFVFGWDQFRPTAKVQGASWYCTGTTGHYTDLEAVFAAGCKPGATLIANTLAPNCWNGELDSPDHRSHMAYAKGDDYGRVKCPATHPNVIPQQENKAQFTVTSDMVTADGKPRIALSSDHMLASGKPGQTLHADYMEGWFPQFSKLWLDHCIDKGLNCSGGDLGNGRQLIGAARPGYGWKHPGPRVAVP